MQRAVTVRRDAVEKQVQETASAHRGALSLGRSTVSNGRGGLVPGQVCRQRGHEPGASLPLHSVLWVQEAARWSQQCRRKEDEFAAWGDWTVMGSRKYCCQHWKPACFAMKKVREIVMHTALSTVSPQLPLSALSRVTLPPPLSELPGRPPGASESGCPVCVRPLGGALAELFACDLCPLWLSLCTFCCCWALVSLRPPCRFKGNHIVSPAGSARALSCSQCSACLVLCR